MQNIFVRYLDTPLGIPDFLNKQFKKNGADDWEPVLIETPSFENNVIIRDPSELDEDDFIIDCNKKIIHYKGSEKITAQAFYSFLKELWRNSIDTNKINKYVIYPFPMIAITPEQFEFSDDWQPADSLLQYLCVGGILVPVTGKTYYSVILLGDGYESVVVVTKGKNYRRLQTSKSFMLEDCYSVKVLRCITDYPNKKQFWEEKDMLYIIGLKNVSNQCYRVPVA